MVSSFPMIFWLNLVEFCSQFQVKTIYLVYSSLITLNSHQIKGYYAQTTFISYIFYF